MNDVGNAVGLLIFALIAIGIFLAIRNFLLWYTGIGGVQRLLREQLEETRQLHTSVLVSNALLNRLSGEPLPSEPPAASSRWVEPPWAKPQPPEPPPEPPQRPPGTLPRNF